MPKLDPLVIRLGALQNAGYASASYDPRPASALIQDLASVEEMALRNELPSLPPTLHRAQVADLGTAVFVPQMQDAIARNQALFTDKTIGDMPELVASIPELAVHYREDPRYLFALSQREFLVPQLLVAYLALGLMQQGWSFRYTVEHGFLLEHGTRTIRPGKVIRSLATGEMSKEEFLALLEV